jgi:hypothetical protein
MFVRVQHLYDRCKVMALGISLAADNHLADLTVVSE